MLGARSQENQTIIAQLRQELEQERAKSMEALKVIDHLTLQLASRDAEIGKLKQRLAQQSAEPFFFYDWQWDPTTPYAKHFLIEEGKGTFQEDTGYYQLLSRPLPRTGVHKVRVKFEIYNCWPIMIGLITEERKLEQCSFGNTHPQTLTYWVFPNVGGGDIWMEGKEIVGVRSELLVESGGDVLIELNMDSLKVTFYNVGKEWKEEVKLADSFKDKQLYLYASMDSRGECLQLI